MRMFFVVFLAALSSVASPAQAQTFTGPRVEATIGLDQLRFDLGEDGARTKQSDLGYGGAIGYDAPVGADFVAGIEAGAVFSDGDYALGNSSSGQSVHAGRELSLAARLGARLTPNALVYGKIGYSNFQLRTVDTAGGVDTSQTAHLDGVSLGIGAEVAISSRAYLKSEYRYTDYQDGFIRNNIMTGIGLRF